MFLRKFQVITERNCCRRPGIPCDPQSHCVPCSEPKPPAQPPPPNKESVRQIPVKSQERNPCESIPEPGRKISEPGPTLPCRFIDPPPKCKVPGGGYINPCLPVSCPNSWSKFPWGSGKKTLFHNPHVNFLPADCPDDSFADGSFDSDSCPKSPNMPCAKCGMFHTDLLTAVTIQESSPKDLEQTEKVDKFLSLTQPIKIDLFQNVDEPIRIETFQNADEPIPVETSQDAEPVQVETLQSPEAPKIELVNATTEKREEILNPVHKQVPSRNTAIPLSVKPKETESLKTKLNEPNPKNSKPLEIIEAPKKSSPAPPTPKPDHSAGFVKRSFDGIGIFGGLHYEEVYSEEEQQDFVERILEPDADMFNSKVYDTADDSVDQPCFQDGREQFQDLIHIVENVSCADPGLTVTEVSGKDGVGKDLAKVETFHTLRIPIESSAENIPSDESDENIFKRVTSRGNILKDGRKISDSDSDAHAEEEVIVVHSLHECHEHVDIPAELKAKDRSKNP